MDTERLIHALAKNVEPVRPLARPAQRTIVWAAVAVAYLAMLVLVMSPRGDLSARMSEPRFLIEQTAALLTGLAAAGAAFATVVPGYRRTTVWLPLVPLSVWVGTVGFGAAQEYALAGAAVLVWQLDWACVGAILGRGRCTGSGDGCNAAARRPSSTPCQRGFRSSGSGRPRQSRCVSVSSPQLEPDPAVLALRDGSRSCDCRRGRGRAHPAVAATQSGVAPGVSSLHIVRRRPMVGISLRSVRGTGRLQATQAAGRVTCDAPLFSCCLAPLC